jgi:putative transposase
MVCAYVIMPDHVHLIVAQASSSAVALRQWIGWWKRESLLDIGDRSIVGQKGCRETRIRNEEMFAQKLEYILDNPVRKGLVKHASDWLFMGTFNTPR